MVPNCHLTLCCSVTMLPWYQQEMVCEFSKTFRPHDVAIQVIHDT